MNNIENKIVQMRFDNAQFEAAVAQTMNTLDKFKEKLNFKGAEKGLDSLGKNTGNYNYTLNDIGSSLDMLTNRFSTMGTIGGRILENLTDKAVNFATNGLGNMLSGITQGGLSRAMNLEQAKFQMQGIFKDAEKVKSVIYDDILPELQGTPYSLDQAAVVIGQLGASGVKSSEQVRQATRAIAGLAAMSGRGFDEVGRIFSKVAGQGNMMGGELQQLSTYGINAAANLADYFQRVYSGEVKATDAVKEHVAEVASAFSLDEAGIRDAASKRMIYYEDMAAAMDDLYGAHAKKSTEMYSGALDDLKAALARIGAEPAAVGLNVLRDAFNALVPAVDVVNSVLKKFTNATKDVVKGADGDKVFGGEMYGSLAKKVQNAGVSFANLFVEMDKNGKITRWTAKSIDAYKKSLESSEAAGKKVLKWQKDYAAYASEGDAVMNPQMWRTITALTKSFTNTMTALGKALGAIGKGFAKAFPKLHLKSIASLAEGIERFTKGLILSKKNLERLTDISQAVFTPLGLVVRAVIQIVKAFVAVIASVYKAIKPTLNAIFAFISAVSRTIIGIGEMAVEFSGTAVGALVKFTTTVVGAIIKFLRLDKIFEFIQKSIYRLADLFDLVGSKTGGFFKNFFENTQRIAKSVSDYLGLSKALDILRNGFIRLKDGLVQMLHVEEIKSAIQEVINQIKEFFSSGDLLPKLIDNIKNFIDWIKDLEIVDRIVNGVSDAFDRLVTTVSNLTAGPSSKISGWIKKLGQHLKDIFNAISVGNGEYFKRVFKDSLGASIPTLKQFFDSISNFKNKVLPLLESLIELLPKLFGFEKWGDMMAAAGDKVASFGKAIAQVFGFLGETAANKTVETIDKTGKAVNKFVDKNVTDKVGNFGNALKSVGDGVKSGFGSIGKVLTKAFEGLEIDSAKKFVSVLLTFLMAFMYIKRMQQMSAQIKAMTSMFQGLSGLLGSISSGFGIKNVNLAIAKVIKLIGFATALLLFATALKQLSDIGWKKLIAGSVIMLSALVAFYMIFKFLDKNTGAVDKLKSEALLKLAASVAAMCVGILLLSKAMETIGGLDIKQWAKGLGAVIIILGAFTGILAILTRKDFKSDAAGSFSKAAFSFLGLAKGMAMMAEAIKEIGAIPIDTLAKGVMSIIALMSALALFAKSVTADAKVFSAAVGMVAIAGAIIIICKAISMVQGLMDKDTFVNAFLVITVIFGAMAGFALAAGKAQKSILAAGAGMMLMADALLTIAAAMWIIGAMPTDMFAKAGGAMVVLLSGMIAFAAFASGDALKAGAGLLLLSAAVLTLAGALYVLAALDFGVILVGMGRMILMAVAAGAALWLLSYAAKDLSKEGVLNILLMSGALLMLATAIAIVAAIPIVPLAIALGALVVALVAIGAAMVLLSGVSIGMVAVAAAFLLLGAAVALVGAGLFLFVTALTALIPLLLSLSMIDTDMLSEGLNVLKMVAEGVGDALTAASFGVISFGLACIIAAVGVGLTAIALGVLAAAGILCAIAIVSLAGAIYVLASVMKSSFSESFFQGITAGFQGIGSSILTGFVGLWQKIRDNKGEAYSSAYETGAASKKGMEEGSKGLTDAPTQSLDEFLQQQMPSFNEKFKAGGLDLTSSEAQGILDGKVNIDDALTQSLDGVEGNMDLQSVLGYVGGSDLTAGYGEGALENSDAAKNAVDSVVNSATSAFKGGEKQGASAGEKTGQKYHKGIAKSESPTRAAATKVAKAGHQTLAQEQKSWGTVGRDSGQGFANGIRSKITEVARAAAELVRSAITAAKNEQRSASPSKVFAELGRYADEGYIVGLKSLSGKVATAASDVVGGGIDAVSSKIMEISDAFDENVDINPTITPVVDLTNIDQSASQMSSIFNSALNASAPFGMNAAIAAAAFNDSRNQNDKGSAINKLANKLDKMTESMNSRSLNNYITIDGSADPEGFADDLIRSFRLNARTV